MDNSITRSELASLILLDTFELPICILFPEKHTWDRMKNPISPWHEYGINPGTVDLATGHMDISVCLEDFLLPTENMSNEQFLEYVIYWKMRLSFRIIEEAKNPGIDEGELDDLTLIAMESIGMYPQWTYADSRRG